jgi:hypothetical protein
MTRVTWMSESSPLTLVCSGFVITGFALTGSFDTFVSASDTTCSEGYNLFAGGAEVLGGVLAHVGERAATHFGPERVHEG